VSARRARALLRLAGWFALVVAVTVALGRSGTGSLAPPPLAHPGEWSAWVAGRDPVTAAVALVRVAALLGAWYLLVASVVAVGVRAARADRLARLTDRVTVPVVRRLVAATAGLTLASGITPALALAHPSAPAAMVASAPTSTTTSTPPLDPPPTLTMRLLAPVPEPVPAATAPVPAIGPDDAPTWTVRPGQCFWSIAEEVLQQAWKRPPTDAEIVPYWRALIEANRARLGDPRNPDLIFPAQVFTVPPTPPP
jgi:hypothetical protein